jgi:hypothetical protein
MRSVFCRGSDFWTGVFFVDLTVCLLGAGVAGAFSFFASFADMPGPAFFVVPAFFPSKLSPSLLIFPTIAFFVKPSFLPISAVEKPRSNNDFRRDVAELVQELAAGFLFVAIDASFIL